MKEYQWFVIRATYGREKKAYEYIVKHGGTAFYPTVTTIKVVNGKKKKVEESLLPNLFFVFGTIDEVRTFVEDKVNLSYIRFYRCNNATDNKRNVPLVVPDGQMRSFQIICAANNTDILTVPDNVAKFRNGQLVRITEGVFAGVEGRVARYHGQQRVAVIIDGLLTIATAYIPSAFLEVVE